MHEHPRTTVVCVLGLLNQLESTDRRIILSKIACTPHMWLGVCIADLNASLAVALFLAPGFNNYNYTPRIHSTPQRRSAYLFLINQQHTSNTSELVFPLYFRSGAAIYSSWDISSHT